jgi:hypothetical protein
MFSSRICSQLEDLVRRGVCARYRPLPRNVERNQGVDQARPAQGFAQSGWEGRTLRCAVPKLNQWGRPISRVLAGPWRCHFGLPGNDGEVSFCRHAAGRPERGCLPARAAKLDRHGRTKGGDCVDDSHSARHKRTAYNLAAALPAEAERKGTENPPSRNPAESTRGALPPEDLMAS